MWSSPNLMRIEEALKTIHATIKLFLKKWMGGNQNSRLLGMKGNYTGKSANGHLHTRQETMEHTSKCRAKEIHKQPKTQLPTSNGITSKTVLKNKVLSLVVRAYNPESLRQEESGSFRWASAAEEDPASKKICFHLLIFFFVFFKIWNVTPTQHTVINFITWK